MHWFGRRLACVILVLFALLGGPAQADDTSVGAVLYVGNAKHIEPNGTSQINVVPVPVFVLTWRKQHLEFAFQGTPGTQIVQFSDRVPGAPSSTSLSYLRGALRYYIAGGHHYIGYGLSLLNQETAYAPVTESLTLPNSQQTIDRSRIAAGFYELGWVSNAGRRSYADVSISLSPSLHSVVWIRQITKIYAYAPTGTLTNLRTTDQQTGQPEHGSQVDAIASWNVRRGRILISCGLRYTSYNAAFDISNALSHTTTLLMPFVGVTFHNP